VEVRSRGATSPVVSPPGPADPSSPPQTAIGAALTASHSLEWKNRVRIVLVISDTPCLDGEPIERSV
jgi:hypothetical protein